MAQKVRFTKDYDVRNSVNMMTAYKAGDEATLTEAQFERAEKAGVVEIVGERSAPKDSDAAPKGKAKA